MQKGASIVSFIFLIVLIVIAGVVIYNNKSTPEMPSSFSLSPTPIVTIQPTKAPDPIVTTWTTYSNDKYSFTLNIPDGWSQQEYTPESGGMIVAFSPDKNLPCGTCTYVHDGYFSIKIFNGTTDAPAYKDFITHSQNIGKNAEYVGIQLDGIKGVLYANTVAVENHGWVYEASLDTNNGNDKVLNSQIFQKAASSLKFTYLIFNK